MARSAHQMFREIISRDSHQLELFLNPGDLYVWNEFPLLHGRERVLELPRTGTGQSVPEQVIAGKYRKLQLKNFTEHSDEKRLVHMPLHRLHELARRIQSSRGTSN